VGVGWDGEAGEQYGFFCFYGKQSCVSMQLKSLLDSN